MFTLVSKEKKKKFQSEADESPELSKPPPDKRAKMYKRHKENIIKTAFQTSSDEDVDGEERVKEEISSSSASSSLMSSQELIKEKFKLVEQHSEELFKNIMEKSISSSSSPDYNFSANNSSVNKSDSVKSSQEDIFKECEDEEVNKKDDQVEVKSSQEDIFEFKSSSGDSYFHEDDEARMRRKKAALAAFDPDEAVKMEYEACIENAPPKSKDERGRKLRRNFLDRRRNLFKRILSQDKMKPESKNKKKIHNGDKSQPSIKQFIDGGGSNDKDVDELFHLSEGEDEDGHENDFEDEELSDITLEKLVKYSQESRNINEVFEKYRKMKEEDEKYEEKQQKLQNEAEKRRKFEEENEKLALNLIETLDDEQFLIGLMDQHWDALKEINAAKGDKEHPVNEICDRLYIWNQDKSTRKALINYTITQPFSRAHQTVILNYFKEKLNIRTEEERINNEEFIWMVLLPSAYIRLYASVFGFELKEAEERIKATPIKDEDY